MESKQTKSIPPESRSLKWQMLWTDEELRAIEFTRFFTGALFCLAGFGAWWVLRAVLAG